MAELSQPRNHRAANALRQWRTIVESNMDGFISRVSLVQIQSPLFPETASQTRVPRFRPDKYLRWAMLQPAAQKQVADGQ
jgi:hypothetical protein